MVASAPALRGGERRQSRLQSHFVCGVHACVQVPGSDGQACWKTANFDLQSDGILRWKSDEAWPWDEGFIDIKKARKHG